MNLLNFPVFRGLTHAQINALIGAPMVLGLEIAYSTTPALRVKAGICWINGKLLSMAQTDFTPGGTMKDISGATVTLAVNSCYYVFPYDNSGTLTARFEKADGTGDGSDPIYSLAWGYWTASDSGAVGRRIGKFFTDGSGNMIPFVMTIEGRIRTIELNQFDAVPLVSSGTQTTPTAITLIPYFGADDASLLISVYIQCTTNPAVCHLYIDGGTSIFASSLHYVTAAGIMAKFEKFVIPNQQSLHYEVNTGGTGALTTIYASGTRLFV